MNMTMAEAYELAREITIALHPDEHFTDPTLPVVADFRAASAKTILAVIKTVANRTTNQTTN